MSRNLPQTPAKGKDSFLKSMDSIIFAVKSGKTPCKTPSHGAGGYQSERKRRFSHSTPQTLSLHTEVKAGDSKSGLSKLDKGFVTPQRPSLRKDPIASENSAVVPKINDVPSSTGNVTSVTPLNAPQQSTDSDASSGAADKWSKTPSGVTRIPGTSSSVSTKAAPAGVGLVTGDGVLDASNTQVSANRVGRKTSEPLRTRLKKYSPSSLSHKQSKVGTRKVSEDQKVIESTQIRPTDGPHISGKGGESPKTGKKKAYQNPKALLSNLTSGSSDKVSKLAKTVEESQSSSPRKGRRSLTKDTRPIKTAARQPPECQKPVMEGQGGSVEKGGDLFITKSSKGNVQALNRSLSNKDETAGRQLTRKSVMELPSGSIDKGEDLSITKSPKGKAKDSNRSLSNTDETAGRQPSEALKPKPTIEEPHGSGDKGEDLSMTKSPKGQAKDSNRSLSNKDETTGRQPSEAPKPVMEEPSGLGDKDGYKSITKSSKGKAKDSNMSLSNLDETAARLPSESLNPNPVMEEPGRSGDKGEDLSKTKSPEGKAKDSNRSPRNMDDTAARQPSQALKPKPIIEEPSGSGDKGEDFSITKSPKGKAKDSNRSLSKKYETAGRLPSESVKPKPVVKGPSGSGDKSKDLSKTKSPKGKAKDSNRSLSNIDETAARQPSESVNPKPVVEEPSGSEDKGKELSITDSPKGEAKDSNRSLSIMDETTARQPSEVPKPVMEAPSGLGDKGKDLSIAKSPKGKAKDSNMSLSNKDEIAGRQPSEAPKPFMEEPICLVDKVLSITKLSKAKNSKRSLSKTKKDETSSQTGSSTPIFSGKECKTAGKRGALLSEKSPRGLEKDFDASSNRIKCFQPSASSTPVTTGRKMKRKSKSKLAKEMAESMNEPDEGDISDLTLGQESQDVSRTDNAAEGSKIMVSCKLFSSEKVIKKRGRGEKVGDKKKADIPEKTKKPRGRPKKQIKLTECSISLFDQNIGNSKTSGEKGTKTEQCVSELDKDANKNCDDTEKATEKQSQNVELSASASTRVAIFEDSTQEDSASFGETDSFVKDSSRVSELNHQTISHVDDMPTKVPGFRGKRGQKRPNIIEVTVGPHEQVVRSGQEETVVVKKKRGRPPKVKTDVENKAKVSDKTKEPTYDNCTVTARTNFCNTGTISPSQGGSLAEVVLQEESLVTTPKVAYTGKKRGRKKKEQPKVIAVDKQDCDGSNLPETEEWHWHQTVDERLPAKEQRKKTSPSKIEIAAPLEDSDAEKSTSAIVSRGKRKRTEVETEDGDVSVTAYKPPSKRKKSGRDVNNDGEQTAQEDDFQEDDFTVKDEDETKLELSPVTPGRSKRAASLRAKQAWSEMTDEMDQNALYLRPTDQLPVSDEFLSEMKAQLIGNRDRDKLVTCPFDTCEKQYWNNVSMNYHLKHCPKGKRSSVYKGYECCQCGFKHQSEKAMKKHVHSAHMKSAKKVSRYLETDGVSGDDSDRDLDWKEGSQSASEQQEAGESTGSEGEEEWESEGSVEEVKIRKGSRKLKVIGASAGKTSFQLVTRSDSRSAYWDAERFLQNFNTDLKVVNLPKMPAILESSFSWTLDFVAKHQMDSLYPEFVYKPGEAVVVTDSKTRGLLANKAPLPVTVSVQGTKKEESPVDLSLFDSHQNSSSGSTTVNVGGPVWAMAWCPTPLSSQVESQLLALYCHTTTTEEHRIHAVKQGPTLLQIWDCGKLDSKSSCSPSLAYCMSLDVGAVWQMCWCPTGCYDNRPEEGLGGVGRVGLLALACSAGHVEIISVPTSSSVQSLPQSDSRQPVMIEPKCRWRLCQQFRGAERANCLCVDWQWINGCRLLVAGFSDGSICLWNLHSSSPLLRRQAPDGATEWLPYRTILGHRDAITGVNFCPRLPNYVISVSLDRDLKLWDLTSPACPMDLLNRVRATSVVAPVNWLLWIAAYDDSLMFARNSSYAVECGYLEKGGMSLISTKSTVRGQSFNHWLNTLAMATTGGEVFLYYMHFGIYLNRVKKSAPHRRLFLYSTCSVKEQDVISDNTGFEGTRTSGQSSSSSGRVSSKDPGQQASGDTVKDSSTAASIGQKSPEKSGGGSAAVTQTENIGQGVLFKDAKLLENKDITKTCGEGAVDCFLSHRTKHTYVNRVSWNPNLGSHAWLASATNGGLLRLHRVSALETGGMRKVQSQYLKHQKKGD